MKRPARELPKQVQPVVSYEDDVHAWMYLDQVDGVLRYEAYVLGYDDGGMPTTLEFVIEEGAFDLAQFPQITPFLPRSWRPGAAKGAPAGSRLPREWNPASLQGGNYTPWDLAQWQWEGLHAFFEEQEQRLKRELRSRWTRRLRALGYDVIRSL